MKNIAIVITLALVSTLSAESYFGSTKKGVAPVDNAFYKAECASCHFAYQPGLLPQRSWKKLMANLEDHFETDASLDTNDTKILLNYLLKNAADVSTGYKRSRKISRSIAKDNTPVAVSDTPYFKKEHREIAKRLIEQKEVKSIANCTACHTTAEKGLYGERYIDIPNYGKWDDD